MFGPNTLWAVMLSLVTAAMAQDSDADVNPDDPHQRDAPSDPAPAPAPAPAPTSGAPTAEELAGTWYVTSNIDGKEVVDWGCANPPDSVEFDGVVIGGAHPEGFVSLVVGGQTNAGKIGAATTKGATLVLGTSVSTCTSTKDVTVAFADSARKILTITRCTGTPRQVRAVRNVSAGVPIMRQCCDPAGKMARRVGANDPCLSGTQGQKPVPLRP